MRSALTNFGASLTSVLLRMDAGSHRSGSEFCRLLGAGEGRVMADYRNPGALRSRITRRRNTTLPKSTRLQNRSRAGHSPPRLRRLRPRNLRIFGVTRLDPEREVFVRLRFYGVGIELVTVRRRNSAAWWILRVFGAEVSGNEDLRRRREGGALTAWSGWGRRGLLLPLAGSVGLVTRRPNQRLLNSPGCCSRSRSSSVWRTEEPHFLRRCSELHKHRAG